MQLTSQNIKMSCHIAVISSLNLRNMEFGSIKGASVIDRRNHWRQGFALWLCPKCLWGFIPHFLAPWTSKDLMDLSWQDRPFVTTVVVISGIKVRIWFPKTLWTVFFFYFLVKSLSSSLYSEKCSNSSK